MEKKYKTFLKDILIFALGSFGSKCILFFLVPLYTNYLTADQYGTADLVFTISQILIPVISLVIFDSVIRFGLESREHPENVLRISYMVWFLGSFFLLVLMPVIGMYKPIYQWKWYLFIYVVINILLSIEMNYLKVKDKNFWYSIISIVQTLLLSLLNIILLVFNDFGVKGYLLSNILACLISCIIAFLCGNNYADLRKSKFDIILFRNMIIYSIPLIFNNLSWWIIQSSDKIMIQVLENVSMLGLYSVATRIPSLLSVLVSVFQQAWGISAITEIDNNDKNNFYTNVFLLFTVFIFLVCLSLNSIIKNFMRFYVSDAFYISWQYVPLLLCAAAFSAIAAYFGSIYGALKKSVNNMVSTLIAGIINFILNIILIPIISVHGAVIGTLTSYIFLSFIRLKDCNRFIKIYIDKKYLIANSCIIIVHAIFISLDIYPSIISMMLLTIYVIYNRNVLFKIFCGIVRFKK